MNKAANNILFEGLSGRLGDLLRDWRTRSSTGPDFRDSKSRQADTPLIRRVERSAERILVQARDHAIVTRVRLTLLDGAGEVLEIGEAIRQEDECWEFIPRSAGQIMIVEAWDLAGRVTSLVL